MGGFFDIIYCEVIIMAVRVTVLGHYEPGKKVISRRVSREEVEAADAAVSVGMGDPIGTLHRWRTASLANARTKVVG